MVSTSCRAERGPVGRSSADLMNCDCIISDKNHGLLQRTLQGQRKSKPKKRLLLFFRENRFYLVHISLVVSKSFKLQVLVVGFPKIICNYIAWSAVDKVGA